MDGVESSTRLRNACDTCHKLKRRCTGTNPCKRCASIGSLCIYSVVRRLGRPRGSRSHHNVQTDSLSARKERPSPDQELEAPEISFDIGSMLDFNIGDLDSATPYNLFANSTENPGAVSDSIPTTSPAPDILREIDLIASSGSSLPAQPDNGTFASVSYCSEQRPRSLPQVSQPPLSGQQYDTQLWTFFLQQQQHQQQIQTRTRRSSQSTLSEPSPSCQCIPHLSSLLHDLKRTEDDKMLQVGPDIVLSKLSDALSRWSAFASCPRCQNKNHGGDDGETLLLAALTMRKIIAQVKASSLQSGAASGNDESGRDDVGPYLQLGTYRIIGSDRTILLRVLRTITFHKLNTIVIGLQSMLRTKQTQCNRADDAILNHVKATLVTLAEMIKTQ